MAKKRKSKKSSKVDRLRAPDVIIEPTPGMGAPTKYLPEYCAKLLQHMKEGGSFEGFAPEIGVHRDTLYEWTKVHKDFSDAKNSGNDYRLQLYETSARNIALGIVPPPPVAGAMMTRGSAGMTIFMLCNLAPDKYKNRFRDDATPPAGSQDTVVNFNYTLSEPEKKLIEE